MLEIGKYSIVRLHDTGYFVLNRLIQSYDLIGKNILCFCNDDGLLASFTKTTRTIKYKNVGDLLNSLKENLFRVDILIIESDYDISKYIRKITDLPILLVTDIANDKINYDNFDFKYSLYIKRKMINSISVSELDSEYFILDEVTNIERSLESIILEFARNFKIDKLINKLSDT